MYETEKERLCATIIDTKLNLDRTLDNVISNDIDAAIFEIHAAQFRLNSALNLIKGARNKNILEERRQFANI